MSILDSEPISLTTQDSVSINQLPTGVRGLDEVLGGGLPEYSFSIATVTDGQPRFIATVPGRGYRFLPSGQTA